MKKITSYNDKIPNARLYYLVVNYTALTIRENNELGVLLYALANKILNRYYPFTTMWEDLVQGGVANCMHDIGRGAYKQEYKNATAFCWRSVHNGMLSNYRKMHPKAADGLEFIYIDYDENGNPNVDVVDEGADDFQYLG